MLDSGQLEVGPARSQVNFDALRAVEVSRLDAQGVAFPPVEEMVPGKPWRNKLSVELKPEPVPSGMPGLEVQLRMPASRPMSSTSLAVPVKVIRSVSR